MNMYVLLCLAAVAVVGLIEWLKNFVDVTAHNPLMAVLLGFAILALSQIGYEAIKKAIISRAEKALGVDSEKAN